jgi:hypothetical protein
MKTRRDLFVGVAVMLLAGFLLAGIRPVEPPDAPSDYRDLASYVAARTGGEPFRIVGQHARVSDNLYITKTAKSFEELNRLAVLRPGEEWTGTLIVFRREELDDGLLKSAPSAVIKGKGRDLWFIVMGDPELLALLNGQL